MQKKFFPIIYLAELIRQLKKYFKKINYEQCTSIEIKGFVLNFNLN